MIYCSSMALEQITGSVRGNIGVGSLVGWHEETINNSYLAVDIRRNYGTGGLVGVNAGGTVSSS